MENIQTPEGLPEIGSIWQHVERGTQYTVLGYSICCTNGLYEGEQEILYGQLSEGEPDSVYQKGVVLNRLANEFMDGRFVRMVN